MGLRHSQAIRGIAMTRKAAEKLDGLAPKKTWGQAQLKKHGVMRAVLLLVGKGKTYNLIESAIKKDPYAEERIEMYLSSIRGLGGRPHIKGLLRALNMSKSKVWYRQRAVEHSVPSSARGLTSRFIKFETALNSRLRDKGRIDMHYLVRVSDNYHMPYNKALAILDRVKLKHRTRNLPEGRSK